MTDLPDKLYYSIREVSTHTKIEPHVLRYWESEFPSLRPKRNRGGTRTYRRKDVDEILAIRQLLHDEGYRIEGARKALRDRQKAGSSPGQASKQQMTMSFADLDRPEKVRQIKKGLQEVLQMIQDLKPPSADGD
jgi:DNA-binding transcriptional MerR regulator